jgi:DNA-directed RNA polymerase specialized sigma24 family protein
VDINDPKVLEGLSVRLLAFARRSAKLKRWWLKSSDGLAKGRTAEDVACEAIASLFGGKRKWQPASQPDPWEHLKSTVNSLLWGLSVARENRVCIRGVEDNDASTNQTPESQLMSQERRERGYSMLESEILSADDSALLSLHDLIVNEDIHKPEELAPRLGITVADTNNLKKRFWRVCHRTLEKMEKEEGKSYA